MLVTRHHPKLGAHLVIALARLYVQNLARRNSQEAGSTREKMGGEERISKRKQEKPVARERVSQIGE
jgi:hypothetical protein